MSTRPSCDQCGSTNFGEENGLTVCERGHVQEGGQRTGEDDGDYHAAGRVSRKKSEKSKEKIIRLHRGSKGYRLFLKAWQFILWKQCHAMVQRLGLPPDIWTVVKELWGLRLTGLTSRFEDDQEAETQPQSTHRGASGDDAETNAEDHDNTTSTSNASSPTLWETVALNYLGILILRRPISIATIYDLIRDEQICFIRAIRQVPEDIRDRLAPEYHEALDTTTIPQRYDLRKAIHRVVNIFSATFGMVVPPINWRAMLITSIRRLALPLEVYPAVRCISRIVNFDFRYPTNPDKRNNVTSFPEIQLMATLVVATKLLFPFDDVNGKIRPHSLSEPAALSLDWSEWMKAREKQQEGQENPKNLSPRVAIEVTDQELMDMNETQLDRYMDWFQSTYVVEPKRTSNLNKELLAMFPLTDIAQNNLTIEEETFRDTQIAERLALTQSYLRSVEPVTEIGARQQEELLQPGQCYQRARHAHQLSKPATMFYQQAADMACIGLDELVRAVYRTERLLLIAQSDRRRAEVFAGIPEPGFE